MDNVLIMKLIVFIKLSCCFYFNLNIEQSQPHHILHSFFYFFHCLKKTGLINPYATQNEVLVFSTLISRQDIHDIGHMWSFL